VLLEVRAEPAHGDPTTWRVHEDGRFEELTDERSASDRLDAAGLERVRAAVRAALERVDGDHYGAGAAVEGGTRMTWRLGTREIVVDGYPLIRVGALDDVLQTLLRERARKGTISTRWIWEGESREFAGEPAALPQLVPLLDLVLPERTGDVTNAPAGTPLLEIEWQIDGVPGDRLAVYHDGKRILEEDGVAREAGALDASALEALRDGLQAL
jgi:hypothetical protein